MEERTKDTILSIIEPAYVEDVKNAVDGRRTWKKAGDVCEAFSKVLAGIASILAFSSGVYDYRELSFVSGCVGTISIVLGTFGTYANGESRERTIRLNTILNHVGLQKMVMPYIQDNEKEEENEQQQEEEGQVARLARQFTEGT